MSVYKKDAESALAGNRKVLIRHTKKIKHFLGSSLITVLFTCKLFAVSYYFF